MAEGNCPNCDILRKRIAVLEERVGDLEARLDAALRSAKRQTAPFSKANRRRIPRSRAARRASNTASRSAAPLSASMKRTMRRCPSSVPIAAAMSSKIVSIGSSRPRFRAGLSSANSRSTAAIAASAATTCTADTPYKPALPLALPKANSARMLGNHRLSQQARRHVARQDRRHLR